MALKFQGGQANEKMLPLRKDVVARLNWLRQRELRLKDQLRTGEIELAAQTISEILETAQPGDINQFKAEGMQNAIHNAIKAMNAARGAYNGSLVKS